MNFITDLSLTYSENASPNNAIAMEKYMKNHFTFFGLKTDVRRSLLKKVWTDHKDEVRQNVRDIAQQLYQLPQREYHYTAVEILMKELKKEYAITDVVLFEKLITTHSWWDTVDVIAKYLVGGYLQQYPEMTQEIIEKFSDSENIWLNRTAILFQLGYKQRTDTQILFAQCIKHSHSKEFFIQKAIGWALREYAKTDPDAVKKFVPTAMLKPLSIRESLKNI